MNYARGARSAIITQMRTLIGQLLTVVAGQIASLGVFAAIRPSALYSHYHAATSSLG